MPRKRPPGRPPGALEEGHEERRRLILDRLVRHLFARKRLPALKGLAEAAGVSVSTLVHYFETRDGLCVELLGHLGEAGEQFHLPKVREPSGPLARSIRDLCRHLADGLLGPLQAIHEFGFVEGLRDDEVARAYLGRILDATLDAVATRLGRHVQRGEMVSRDLSVDAIQLVGPIILAAFHQQAFGGAHARAIPLRRVAKNSAEAFLAQKM